MDKLNETLHLENFPETIDRENNIRIYGQISRENQLALLTHYIHNPHLSLDNNLKQLVREAVHEFLLEKAGEEPVSEEEITSAAESPLQYTLFDDFFHVPFPNPTSAKRTFIDLFAGIGGIRLPFHELGYQCVFSSEWDKYAQQTYLANFGEMPFGDITKESTKYFIPAHFDLLLAGFPCQAFSIMGKMRGFEDIRGTMFFEVATILKKHKPKAILLENVKQLTSHDKGRTFKVILQTLKELGYFVKWDILNALDFGVPQKRERVIIVGFTNQNMCNAFNFDFEKRPYNLSDILEEDEKIDSSLQASDFILKKRIDKTIGKNIFYPSVWHENKSGNISILDHACALRAGSSYNYLLINGTRRPSSRELLRFQGFPDSYRVVVSHTEIRRQTGNSVAVPMIRAVAKKIDYILENIKE